MKILAIDTATEACSAAIAVDGTVLARYDEPGRGHAERILPMIDELLAEAGLALAALDAIAFGRGPGGFTGVRIAAGVAQGLAFGAGLPVVPVSDLEALATRALKERAAAAALICMDARMSEVYWCAFERMPGSGVQALDRERVGPPASVSRESYKRVHGRWLGAGTGFAAYPDLGLRLAVELDGTAAALLPRAEEVAFIAQREFSAGRVVDPAQAMPVYVRDQVVAV